jgi:hypothetical protein
VEYRLAFTQFKGKLVRRLVRCDATPEIAMLVEAVSAQSAADWDHRYVLDYAALSHAFKTSSVEVKRYPGGQLQSINAKAEDRSAAVVGAIASTALKFFTPIDPALGGGEDISACTASAKTTLLAVDASKDDLRRKVGSTERLSRELGRLTDQIQLTTGAAGDRLRDKVSRTALKLQKAKDEQAAEQENLTGLLAKITVTDDFTWPVRSSDTGPFLMPFSSEYAKAWFNEPWATIALNSTCAQLWLERSYAETKPQANSGSVKSVDLQDPNLGVRYREGEPGALVIRRSPRLDAEPSRAANANEYCARSAGAEEFRFASEVLQFGRVMILPFDNRAFQKNSLEATWDETGRLTMLKYGEEASSAEAAAALGATLTEAVRETVSKRRGEELAELKAEKELLETQSAVIDARRTSSAASASTREAIANFDADKRLAEAERAAIEAELSLREARAKLDGS